MNTFKLKVVASNKVFFDDECESLIVPVADDGLCGFLANHENTVAPIEFGEMTIKKPDDSKIEAFVCLSVELPEEIDKRRAEEAKERAEEELRQKQSVLEHLQSQANLARAMERIKVKNRHEI